MNLNKLTTGTNLKGRTSGKVRVIEDYHPATPLAVQRWQVNGAWLNYAQLEARYALHAPTGRAPKNRKEVASA